MSKPIVFEAVEVRVCVCGRPYDADKTDGEFCPACAKLHDLSTTRITAVFQEFFRTGHLILNPVGKY